MPTSSISLTSNELLTSDTFMKAQHKYLATLQVRMDENLRSYKKMLAAVEEYVHMHFQDEERNTLLALFAQNEYNIEVVKRTRAAHFRNDSLERNPLFMLAEDLSDFLETVSSSTDEMTNELARHAILLTHDMFFHANNYHHKNAEDLSKTLRAAGEYYKEPLNSVKHTIFTDSIFYLARDIDDRSSLDNFIIKHPKLSTFIIVALITMTVASIILMMIPTLPHIVPLIGAAFTTLFGMTGAFGTLILSTNKERLENKTVRYKDEKVDNFMASLKTYSLFAPEQSVNANAAVMENEQPLLSEQNRATI
jgi:hypothetical protein